LQIHRDQREQQSNEIREVVPGLREQCQGMRFHSGYYQQHDVSGGYTQRDAQDARCPLSSDMGMDMHASSLRTEGMGFKAAVGDIIQHMSFRRS